MKTTFVKTVSLFLAMLMVVVGIISITSTAFAAPEDLSLEVKQNSDGTVTLNFTDKGLKDSYFVKLSDVAQSEQTHAAFQWIAQLVFGDEWKIEAHLIGNSAMSFDYSGSQKPNQMDTNIMFMKYNKKNDRFDFDSESKPIKSSVKDNTISWTFKLPSGCKLSSLTESSVITIDINRDPRFESLITFQSESVDISKAVVYGIKDKLYTGEFIFQDINVKLGDKTLNLGTDYSVMYKDNLPIGKASLTIKGKGKYKNELKCEFLILPHKVQVTSATFSKNSKDADVILNWKRLSHASGYNIFFSPTKDGKFDLIAKIDKNSTTSYTVKKLKGAYKGYFKVQAFKDVGEDSYVGDYSKAIKPKKV